ncbi:MAG: hypothetical protein CMJ24_07800 [Phycisphaerae bacterium]|nr:hypothetical protein [Phycisphaerae bacterium]MDG1898879.1 lamin tail domain-containing protein [Phycisphaerales bacterium]
MLLYAMLLSNVLGSDVVFTEIMYDPASPEKNGEAEWVEIANLSGKPVAMKDWALDDEDPGDWGRFSATLEPGQVAVLINADATTEEEFLAAWTDPDDEPRFLIIPVSWASLANRPTADNEVLQLLNTDGDVVAEANYRQDEGWPASDRSGGSIYMKIPDASRMNQGDAWARSRAGVDDARACTPGGVFSRPDVGSPGTIPSGGSTTNPATPAPRAPSAPKPAPAPAPKAPADSTTPAEPESPPAPPEDDDIPY